MAGWVFIHMLYFWLIGNLNYYESCWFQYSCDDICCACDIRGNCHFLLFIWSERSIPILCHIRVHLSNWLAHIKECIIAACLEISELVFKAIPEERLPKFKLIAIQIVTNHSESIGIVALPQCPIYHGYLALLYIEVKVETNWQCLSHKVASHTWLVPQRLKIIDFSNQVVWQLSFKLK